MSEDKAKFDIEFEDDILGQCLRDDAYLRKAANVCSSHHFGTKEHAWVWKVIHDTWTKYRERANVKIIIAKSKEDFKKEEERTKHLSLVRRLLKTKPAAPKAAIDELSKFVHHVNLQLAMERGAEALERGDLKGADEAVVSASKARVAERIWTHVPWIEGFEGRQAARKYEKEHPEMFKTVPTPWKKINKVLSGGMRAPEVWLIMGTTGRGKSIALNNILASGTTAGFNGVNFVLEMPAAQAAQRQDSLWFRIAYDKFKTYNFTPSELRDIDEMYKRAKKKFANKVHFLSMPVRAGDIRVVRSALDHLKEEYGFKADFVCMDSGDHLRSVDLTLESFRLQQSAVYWDLKQLAMDENMVMISSVHAGKEWAVQIATAEATSESYDKARIADGIISINDPNAKDRFRRRKAVSMSTDDGDDGEEEEGEVTSFAPEGRKKLELLLAKYRDGASNVKIPIDADLSRMRLWEEGAAEDDDEKEVV